ncbi:HGGxSTG domain-containing protein [Chromobacterium vaccinii]|uniref:HGGxSTG domain-containing protein n=1 Tax=Chromobacterium vaccinii TaxID=1108595 RepID=UPI0031DEB06A
MTEDERRKLLKAHSAEYERVRAERERLQAEHGRASWAHFEAHLRFLPPATLPPFPQYPEECQGLTCGARTRAGTPCKLTSIYGNGRCKLHGGLSTGPRTTDGKRRAAQNGTTPKRKQTP